MTRPPFFRFRAPDPFRYNPDDLPGNRASQHPDLPVFMHPVEFAQLAALLQGLGPRRCLEWGSGGSTAACLRLLPTVETWVSIEHDRAWHDRVRDLIDDPRLSLHHVPPTEPEPPRPEGARGAALDAWRTTWRAWIAACETRPSILAEYVALPGRLHDRYDFILVDGRARNACLRAGWELLGPGGVMVLHDAQRPVYHDTVRALGSFLFVEPWVQGQLCVLRRP
jgi:hypothetical protein